MFYLSITYWLRQQYIHIKSAHQVCIRLEHPMLTTSSAYVTLYYPISVTDRHHVCLSLPYDLFPVLTTFDCYLQQTHCLILMMMMTLETQPNSVSYTYQTTCVKYIWMHTTTTISTTTYSWQPSTSNSVEVDDIRRNHWPLNSSNSYSCNSVPALVQTEHNPLCDTHLSAHRNRKLYLTRKKGTGLYEATLRPRLLHLLQMCAVELKTVTKYWEDMRPCL